MTSRLGLVVVPAAIVGFLTGAWQQPTWQDVVEPAQVLAGLVSYPADNPVYLYSTLTWTLLHQITAALLTLGIAEVDLTVVISGVIGALSFVGLALATRACGAPAPAATAAPLLIYLSGVARLTPGYPVLLLGWPYTYGLIAHALAVMVLALVALRRDRLAAVLLGVLPAVHPGMGGLLTLVVAGVIAIYAPLRMRSARVWPWWCLGLGITLASAALHWGVFVPDTSHLMRSPELEESLRVYWDGHRQPLAYTTTDVIVALAVPIVMLFWCHTSAQQDADGPARELGLLLLVAVAIGVAADLVLRVAPAPLAQVVSMPMPTRLLVLPVLVGAPWFIGIATSATTPGAARMVLQAMLVGLVAIVCPVVGVAEQMDVLEVPGLDWLVNSRGSVAQAILLILGAGLVAAFLLPRSIRRHLAGTPLVLVEKALPAVLTALVTFQIVQVVRDHTDNPAPIADRTTNAVLAAAAAGTGLLVTDADLHLMQAATRRPLLIDPGALDGLPYVPVAVRMSDHILRDIYDTTLGAPPEGDEGATGVVPSTADDTWVSRTPEQWRALGAMYGFTDILTTPELTLQLPEVARDDTLVLWRIPRPAAAPHP
jgi:hypothetical protein